MSNVRCVQGEPVKFENATSIIEPLLEGPGIYTSKATDTDGESATGTAYGREAAEDRAYFNLVSKRD